MKFGPKYKICKRLGPDVFEKCQTPRFALVSSRGTKSKKGGGRASRSDYGKHMLEKQRVRLTYGVSERQFSRYVKDAAGVRGLKPADTLYRAIESRLDNIVYRLALAPTRAAARQLVSHGHIVVNDRRITSPSYAVRVGERVGVRENSRARGPFRDLGAKEGGENKAVRPAWLAFDVLKLEGSIIAPPSPDAAGTLPFDLQSVVEFYSR